jgi:hypothetical protein|mmetsp:Transcript_8498/g.10162  ORF Transcript_8498/g.10162 Transcript_8498/m.10162 type:complete len:87 (+) Transcript_8498:1041-1301(+)
MSYVSSCIRFFQSWPTPSRNGNEMRAANRRFHELTHQIEPVIDISIQETETRTAPNNSCGMNPHVGCFQTYILEKKNCWGSTCCIL